MVIDMNEAQAGTVEQMLQVLAGMQALELRQAGDDKERYAWIASVLRRLDYGGLKKRPDRGVVLMYLQRLSGYSRAQVKRLVATWLGGKPLVKRYRAPEHAFTRCYTAADVALLVDVDRAMGTLSGPATGYVITGTAGDVADGVNAYLTRVSRNTEQLQPADIFDGVPSWVSQHIRSAPASPIHLHHALLCMDAAA
jgi:hypothetical protein